MNILTRARLMLWIFGQLKVPMIGYVKPKILQISEQELLVKIHYRRRTKNHLNSMYFGVLAVGADVTGGLLAVYFANAMREKISLVFKSFHADFIKRPETDVYFVCQQGEKIKNMILQAKKSQERVNEMIKIDGYTNYQSENAEKVVTFDLELSIKVKQ